MRRFSLLAILALLSAPALHVRGAAGFTLLGEWTSPAGTTTEAVAAEAAGSDLVLLTSNGIRILDATDPIKLVRRSDLSLQEPAMPPAGPFVPKALKVVGDYAYVLGETDIGRLFVVNISDRDHPSIATNLALPTISYDGQDVWGRGVGLAAEGDRLYVSLVFIDNLAKSAICIYDISDPAAPAMIKRIDAPRLSATIEVANGLAYLGRNDGLEILDVSNPAAVVKIGQNTSIPVGIASLKGHFLYTGQGDRFSIYDVTDPSVPTLKCTIPVLVDQGDTTRLIRGIRVIGSHAYISKGQAGTYIVDVSDPAAPVVTGNLPTRGLASQMLSSGTLAYSSEGKGGVTIYNVSNSAAPIFTTTYRTAFAPAGHDSLVESNGYVYVGDAFNGVSILDARNTNQPTEAAFLPITDPIGAITLAGQRLYVATHDGFHIVDVSNPAAPVKLGRYSGAVSILSDTDDVEVFGNRAYTSALEVVDVSDPSHPQLLGPFDTGKSARLDTVNGALFRFIRGGGFLLAYDISPQNTMLAGVVILGQGYTLNDVTSSDHFLYTVSLDIPSLNFRLTVADISGTSAIKPLKQVLYPMMPLYAVAASDDTLLLGTAITLDLVDISDRLNPTNAASISLEGIQDLTLNSRGISCVLTGNSVRIYQVKADPAHAHIIVEVVDGKLRLRWPAKFAGMKLYAAPQSDGDWVLVTANPQLDTTGEWLTFEPSGSATDGLFYKLGE